MRTDLLKRILGGVVVALSVCVWSHEVIGQASCLSDDDVHRMLAQVKSPQSAALNKKLRDQLLKFEKQDQKRVQEANAQNQKPDVLMNRMRASREENAAQLCPILKEFGWPTTALVGRDGVAAAFLLLKRSSSFELQADLLPVITAAVEKGEISRSLFAGYVDRLRLRAGLKQLFGTEATMADGFLVLYPIEAEAQVDARRKEYGLPPLIEYIRALERLYRTPLVKSTEPLTNSFADNVKSSIAETTTANLFAGGAVEKDEVIRIDTNLVSMNVSVYSDRLRTHVSALAQKDFAVSEDGHEQAITFFSTTDVPFDLVLLIDLSGSTSGKRDLIRKTTRRFIEAARPSDRLAIVTFSDTTSVISPLTADRANLLQSVRKIDGSSGTSSDAWDALKFTLDQVVGPKTLARRRAVVFMTDGVDTALEGFELRGSEILVRITITFADLVEAVRRSDTLIIPIYLDTEGKYGSAFGMEYKNARKTLTRLADESGGIYYRAGKIADLDGVYAQVIEDLGKVYSLGYKPTNEKRDGSWRAVNIQIANQPDLKARARPGYYSN